MLNKTDEACKKARIGFAYHNHDAEFRAVEGQIPYEMFLSQTKMQMELDLAWATKGGKDPVELFKQHPGRFPLWHVKDLDEKKKLFYRLAKALLIDPDAVLRKPAVLVAFVLLILLVRGVPVYRATLTDQPDGHRFTRREAVAMGLFASTGLPIIVAVTTVAVASGHLTPENASVLVAGGAVTVLVCPLLGSACCAGPGSARRTR